MSASMTQQDIRDGLIHAANDAPALIAAAKTADPALAAFLSGKSLAQSKTVWVSILTPIIAALVTRYGLNWDAATVGEVATGLTTLAMILMRSITSTPITGVVTPATRVGT